MAAHGIGRGVLGATVLGLLALLGWGLLRHNPAASSPGVNTAGSEAPLRPRPAGTLLLQLFDPPPTRWQLVDYRGQTVVVNFWASWCAPCRSEAAVLAQAAREYPARGITVVGVNLWDDPAAARAFLAELGVRYPNGQDLSSTVGVDYGVTGIPETFVVDGHGQLIRRWVGPVTRAALDSLVAP